MMATVAARAARAAVNQVLARNSHQAQRVVESAIGEQACIGGDTRTVELQLEAVVEIEPESIGLGSTRWLRQHRLNPMR